MRIAYTVNRGAKRFVEINEGQVLRWQDGQLTAVDRDQLPRRDAGLFRSSWATLSFAANPRTTSEGSVTRRTHLDWVEDYDLTATTVNDGRLVVSYEYIVGDIPSITYSSSNTAVATVDSSGKITHVSDGSVTITATFKTAQETYSIDLPVTMATSGGQETHTLVSFVDGSLSKHAADAVDTRIAGRSASTAKPIFTTQDHASGTYVRNPQCWCADIDLTGISPWNSTGGANMAGALIHPQYAAFAKHYAPATGATVRFIAADGTVVTRTVLDKATHPDVDICIAILDSAAPASITPAKMLPEGYADYFGHGMDQVPGLALDKEEKALIKDVWMVHEPTTGGLLLYVKEPVDAQRLLFHEDLIGGDSGNPFFWIIGGELVLLTTWHAPHYGPSYADYLSWITSTMTALATNNSQTAGAPTYADLSTFNTYA